jgi:hypothetical protein
MVRKVAVRFPLPIALAVLSTCTSDVFADQAVAKVMLHGMGMATRHQDAPLKASRCEPDILEDNNVRLGQDGLLLGGGLSASLMIARTRFGAGVTFFGVRDTRIVYDPMPEGYAMQGGRLWGQSMDLRLGREFRVGPFFPYIDLRLAFTMMVVNTRLVEQQQGELGDTPYSRISLGLGPVAGLFVPLDEDFFVDLSGYAGLFGDEKMGGTIGLGAWYEL